MTLLTDPRMATVVLTRGGQWTQQIFADPGTAWPTGTAYAIFYDSAGGVITSLDGVVTDLAVTFDSPPADTDGVPAGAGFEVFLTTTGGTYKLRYGKVVRKEVTFPDAPGSQASFAALQYRDTFQRTALGSRWVAVDGRTSIFTGTNPYGVGPNIGLLYQHSSIRYYAPLNGNSVRSTATLLNPGAGKTTMVFCADQNFTSYLGVQFDTTTSPNHIRIGVGSSPTTITQKAISNDTLSDHDRYMAFYDELTKTTYVYKGSDLTPTLSWPDVNDEVPHGPGYRYLGFCWQADLITTGPLITDWLAQDSVGPTTGDAS